MNRGYIMSRLPITEVYSCGFVDVRVVKRNYQLAVHCDSCSKYFNRGLGRSVADNDDDMCVAAVADGWKLFDTSTFCGDCSKLTLFWVYRSAGWLFNFFPPPIPLFLTLLLVISASLTTQYTYTTFRPIQEVTVTEEQTP
jgi:hypothetical protein